MPKMMMPRRKMRRDPFGVQATPQNKLIRTGANFGYPGIRKMQGSTLIIYDFLPMDGRTLFEFFKSVRTRTFPFTNLPENKLQVAESTILQRMYLSMITVDAETGFVDNSQELDFAGLSFFYRSDLNFFIANNQVLKPLNVQSFQPEFNYASQWGGITSEAQNQSTRLGNAVWHAETLINIPPLIEFLANLRTDGYTPIENAFLGLTIEGTAAILAPRETF